MSEQITKDSSHSRESATRQAERRVREEAPRPEGVDEAAADGRATSEQLDEIDKLLEEVAAENEVERARQARVATVAGTVAYWHTLAQETEVGGRVFEALVLD